MRNFDAGIGGRSMRWYEWLIALLLLGLAGGLRAAPIYKCTDAAGGIAYQDHACAAARQDLVDVEPAPAFAPSPEYAVPKPNRPSSSARRTRREADGPMSYECRVANGEVFYRHSPCPHTIAGTPGKSSPHAGAAGTAKLTVSSRQISRSEACAEIHRSGAIGRKGRERDDDVSTYDRNLGRDPCK